MFSTMLCLTQYNDTETVLNYVSITTTVWNTKVPILMYILSLNRVTIHGI